jgi:hypothetical protein
MLYSVHHFGRKLRILNFPKKKIYENEKHRQAVGNILYQSPVLAAIKLLKSKRPQLNSNYQPMYLYQSNQALKML